MINILNGYHYSVFASCPSVIWQVFLFMSEIGSLFASYDGGVFLFLFYCLFFFFFFVWFDKNDYDNDYFFFFLFYILGAAPSLSLPAASVCVTMLCLFQTCIIIKKMLKVIMSVMSVYFAAYILHLLSCLLFLKKDMIIVLLKIPQHPYLTVTYSVFVLKKVTFESYIYI